MDGKDRKHELRISSCSVEGRRNNNQDACGWYRCNNGEVSGYSERKPRTDDHDLFFGIVCDGMGGLQDGAEASGSIVNGLLDWITDVTFTDIDDLCNRILNKSKELEDCLKEIHPRSGTTVVAVIGVDNIWKCLHLGDSRCYSYDGNIITRTKDHSPVEEMLTRGFIDESEVNDHPMKNMISKYIGGGYATEMEFTDIENWRSIVLCSDGACGALNSQDFETLIKDDCDAESIVNACYEAGSKDNITVIRIDRRI